MPSVAATRRRSAGALTQWSLQVGDSAAVPASGGQLRGLERGFSDLGRHPRGGALFR